MTNVILRLIDIPWRRDIHRRNNLRLYQHTSYTIRHNQNIIPPIHEDEQTQYYLGLDILPGIFCSFLGQCNLVDLRWHSIISIDWDSPTTRHVKSVWRLSYSVRWTNQSIKQLIHCPRILFDIMQLDSFLWIINPQSDQIVLWCWIDNYHLNKSYSKILHAR